MFAAKRATVYFDPALHRVARLMAIETDQSLSDVVHRIRARRISC
jgi:hypothetical protein